MINFLDTKNREKMLELDKNSLIATLSIQKNLNSQLLTFMKNYMGNVQINANFNSDSKAFYYINTSVSMLSKSNDNIKSIKILLNMIEEFSKNIPKRNWSSALKEKANNYNEQFNDVLNSVYENTTLIEEFIHEISVVDISELLKELTPNTDEAIDTNTSPSNTIFSNELNLSYIENALIISDIQGKVFLPYTIEKIEDILQDDTENKYSSISDVIEKVYTKPMKYYKFSAIARFREAYKLMIQREHSTKFKALCLASELFANYSLHPAIITACESLNQLDIYLACLEDNTLDDFHYFDIKYEIPPVTVTE